MVQFVKTTQKYGQIANTVFEVPMIANKNGEIVTASNPFPVTMGSGGTSGGTISAKPFYLDVVQGNVTGYSFNHKFGAVPSMSQNTLGSVWDVNDTLYPWTALDTPAIVNVERNNVADEGKTITVQGLDSNYDFVEEDITISGADTTGSTLFKRVNRCFVASDSGANTGDIDIEAGAAGGTTVARIQAGNGQTLMAVYTVPAGKTAYMLQLNSSAADDTDCTLSLFEQLVDTGIFRIQDTFEMQRGGGAVNQAFQAPITFVEKTDIDVRVQTRANNKRITTSFDLLLVDN